MTVLFISNIKFVLRNIPLLRGLQPGGINSAKLITQSDIFHKLTQDNQMSGVCLDAGCGEGLYSEFLESFSAIDETVNLDLKLPQIPDHRSDSRHRAKQGSVTCLPFEDATFDSCLCSEVIEHIEDDAVAVSELARVIKPGGLLLISVPTPPASYDPAHVREGYTLQDLSNLLTNNGFILQKHSYCFHVCMRLLVKLWQWQFNFLGKNTRSYMPRLFIDVFGYADKHLKLGKPWDLAILAQKSTV